MRKPKGKSGMDIPEKLATLGTQDTRGRQAKPKKRTNPNWYNDFNKKTVSPIR
jgi:hypothetical protein